MKFLSCVLLATTLSATAHASYLESCEFQTKVMTGTEIAIVDGQSHRGSEEMDNVVLVVQVTAAKDLGSHVPTACDSYVGGLQVLKVEAKVIEAVEVGSALKLKFFYVSGRGPQGMSSSTTWTLIK